MKTEIQELQSLVTIAMKMIREDYPDTVTLCSKKDSMWIYKNGVMLGQFKAKIKLTQKDTDLIKRNEPITNELIRLDLCERAIK